MEPPFTVALTFCPEADMAREDHALVATPDEVHVCPYVDEYQMEPPATQAHAYCPDADIPMEDHASDATPEDVHVCP